MPYLLYLNNQSKEIRYELHEGVNTIGRHPDNSVCNDHLSLSRFHAQILVDGNAALIVDSQSRNGTYVNNLRIQRCELKDGDQLRFGEVFFRFVQGKVQRAYDLVKPMTGEVKHISDLLDPEQDSSASGSAIKLRQAASQEQRNLDKLNILLDVGRELGAMPELEKLLAKLLDLLFVIMDIDRAAILLANPDTQALEPKAVKTRHSDRQQRIYSQQIVNFIFNSGNAVISNNPETDQRFDGSDSILVQSIRASMGVPLKLHNHTMGVLYVDSLTAVSAYTEEDLEFLAAIAGQATVAIENNLLSERIRAAAVMQAKFARFFPKAVSQRLQESEALEIIETEATILFADITNFSQLSSVMPPRQVIAMLNAYFTVMVEDIIFRYEGTLEKYIGDALLAVWGAPYPHNDDPYRAIQAALAMQNAMTALNQTWQEQQIIPQQLFPIQIHIGIHTGMVAAGNIGSPQLIQYATIGDTTNLASRICGEAKGGDILLSQSTATRLEQFDRSLMTHLPLEKLPPVTLKGRSEPIQLFRLHWQNV
jgi:adenylate cyclase